jgi:hypothetical protein
MPFFLLIAAMVLFAKPAVAVMPATENPAPDSPRLTYVEGIAPNGDPSQTWTEMVRRLRGGEVEPSSAAPLTPDEAAWANLIASRIAEWNAEIPSLAQHFGSIDPPATARIVVGNQGGEDAFTFDAQTIGFDVGRLLANYGRSDLQENHDRLDRFFRHEYVHLLQKRWLQRHPYSPTTPVEKALFGIWTEGLGNYYSLSGRWRGNNDALSDHARKTLETLSPRLVDRIRALGCAGPQEADVLLSDLSFGPFDQKWGALPAALWIAAEVERSPDALRRFVDAGPAGVWEFLVRNLPDQSRMELIEARAAAGACMLRPLP